MYVIFYRDISGPVDKQVFSTAKFLAEEIEMENNGVWATGEWAMSHERGKFFFPMDKLKYIKEEKEQQ